jgi:hypothetical protein
MQWITIFDFGLYWKKGVLSYTGKQSINNDLNSISQISRHETKFKKNDQKAFLTLMILPLDWEANK